MGLFAYLALCLILPDRRNHKMSRPKPKRETEALPASRDDVPPELVEAWREVNEITKN